MRLVTYWHAHSFRLGALYGDWVVDLQRAEQAYLKSTANKNEPCLPADMLQLLEAGRPSMVAARQSLEYVAAQFDSIGFEEDGEKANIFIPLRETFLSAPVPRPGKIICIGMNYPNGKPDSASPDYPIIFLKPASGLIGPGSPIKIPPVTADVAYEAELVVVIGSRAKYVTQEKALDCVAGYTIANDVGARDLEKRTSQWTSGKLMDTFTPLGPALVTPDEVPDPGNLPVVTLLNGQVVQSGSTQDMFFSIPELISYISQLTTLEPGDLILTGSPKTVDSQPAPVISLQPGDSMEISIGNLGKLCNPVIAEQPGGSKA